MSKPNTDEMCMFVSGSDLAITWATTNVQFTLATQIMYVIISLTYVMQIQYIFPYDQCNSNLSHAFHIFLQPTGGGYGGGVPEICLK